MRIAKLFTGKNHDMVSLDSKINEHGKKQGLDLVDARLVYSDGGRFALLALYEPKQETAAAPDNKQPERLYLFSEIIQGPGFTKEKPVRIADRPDYVLFGVEGTIPMSAAVFTKSKEREGLWVSGEE